MEFAIKELLGRYLDISGSTSGNKVNIKCQIR